MRAAAAAAAVGMTVGLTVAMPSPNCLRKKLRAMRRCPQTSLFWMLEYETGYLPFQFSTTNFLSSLSFDRFHAVYNRE